MKKTIAALLAVATIAGTLGTAPAKAQRGIAAGIAAGLIGGAIVGGAIAASRPAPVYYPPGAGLLRRRAAPASRLLLAAPALLGRLCLELPAGAGLLLRSIDRHIECEKARRRSPPGFSFAVQRALIERSTARSASNRP